MMNSDSIQMKNFAQLSSLQLHIHNTDTQYTAESKLSLLYFVKICNPEKVQ